MKRSEHTSDNKALLVAVGVIGVLILVVLTGIFVQAGGREPADTQNTAAQSAQTPSAEQASTQKDQHDACIKSADDLYAEYTAKAPTDSSTADRTAYLQTITQLWNSNKADCDRQYNTTQ